MKTENLFELLEWYSKNKRDLPWRHTKDPYAIWVSEIMLQQTRVEAVKDYYQRFLTELPNMSSLAKVNEERLLKLWEGLGYYSRVRNMKKTALLLKEQGLSNLPNDKNKLLELPGIGAYTAGAILSIAYGLSYPAIDGNVLRVLSRLYQDDRDMNKESVKKEYYDLLTRWMVNFNADEFTQAWIELGALICIPNGVPRCELCPLKNCCLAHLQHMEVEYPKKKNKKNRKIENKTIIVYQYKNTFSILKRENKGLLASMYEFPNSDGFFTLDEIQKNYEHVTYLGEFNHVFSHVEWHMKAYLVLVDKPMMDYIFASKEDIINRYSLPTVFKKIFEKL